MFIYYLLVTSIEKPASETMSRCHNFFWEVTLFSRPKTLQDFRIKNSLVKISALEIFQQDVQWQDTEFRGERSGISEARFCEGSPELH